MAQRSLDRRFEQSLRVVKAAIARRQAWKEERGKIVSRRASPQKSPRASGTVARRRAQCGGFLGRDSIRGLSVRISSRACCSWSATC